MARVDPVITELLDILSNRSYTTSELRNALGISQETLKEYLDVLKSKGIKLGETQDGLTIKDVSGFNEITIQYGLQAPFSIEYHESLASTNDRAADLAADGIFDIAIIADKQTAGQGRQGRTWESPTGGVWMSLSLSPDIDSHLFPLLSLGAGVAIVQTLRDMNISAYLKWPNDVLVGDEGVRGGRKIAGILARSESHDWVVLGMGINANIPARSLPDGATSIQEVSGTVNRRSIVQNILEHFTTLRDEPSRIREKWRTLSTTLNTEIQVTTTNQTYTGIASDISEAGALIINTDEGQITITAGDCTHLRPLE